jgi:hypothetical protein
MTSGNKVPDITLRDIHEPTAFSLWPPGSGWWWLLAFLIVITAVAAWIWWCRSRGPTRAALAQHEFDCIIAPGFGDAFARVTALHLLLRRLAQACPGGEAWAANTTGQWLDWLSRQAGLADCPPALATQVASVPFQAPHAVDAEPLVAHTRAIIDGLTRLRSDATQRVRLGG